MADSKLETIPDALRAAIPAGLRPELVHGLALWLAGYSIYRASEMADVPKTTLWEQIQALPDTTKADRANYTTAAEDAVMPLILEAARQTHEHLINGAYTPMGVATVMGISVDKLVNLGRLRLGSQPPTDGLEGLMGRLLEQGGGSVTMSVEPSAIDVTPAKDDE